MINAKHDYEPRRSNATSTLSATPPRLAPRRQAQASCRFKSAVLKRAHLNQVVHHQAHNNKKPRKEDKEDREDEDRELRQQGAVQHVLKECRRAFHVPQSGEKHHHHQKRKEKEKNQKNNGEDQYEYQYDRYGQQTQQPGRQQRSACKHSSGDNARGNDSTVDNVLTTMSRDACDSARGHAKHKKDYKRVCMSCASWRHAMLTMCSRAR